MWCSFITFPLYVIITQVKKLHALVLFAIDKIKIIFGLKAVVETHMLVSLKFLVMSMQMGSRFKKSVVSENVRKSLSKWQRRVKDRQSSSYALLSATSTTSSSDPMLYEMDKSNHSALICEEGSSSGTKDICFPHFDDVSKAQRNGPFPSHEDHHDHDVNDDSSPPPLP